VGPEAESIPHAHAGGRIQRCRDEDFALLPRTGRTREVVPHTVRREDGPFRAPAFNTGASRRQIPDHQLVVGGGEALIAGKLKHHRISKGMPDRYASQARQP
jgi:hypothetical protein